MITLGLNDLAPETPTVSAHRHCMYNRKEIEQSILCGCFYCMSLYPPTEIIEYWDENDTTAVCPRCGIDAVLGDASGFPIIREFMDDMHAHWF